MAGPRFDHGDSLIESLMAFVDTVLYEFKGQLSYNDILHMSFKELGYLRKHRELIYREKAKNATIVDAISEAAY